MGTRARAGTPPQLFPGAPFYPSPTEGRPPSQPESESPPGPNPGDDAGVTGSSGIELEGDGPAPGSAAATKAQPDRYRDEEDPDMALLMD